MRDGKGDVGLMGPVGTSIASVNRGAEHSAGAACGGSSVRSVSPGSPKSSLDFYSNS